MERRITTCDVCNKEGWLYPPFGHIFPIKKGRGIYNGSMKVAKKLGWKSFRDGSGLERHICLACQKEGKDP